MLSLIKCTAVEFCIVIMSEIAIGIEHVEQSFTVLQFLKSSKIFLTPASSLLIVDRGQWTHRAFTVCTRIKYLTKCATHLYSVAVRQRISSRSRQRQYRIPGLENWPGIAIPSRHRIKPTTNRV